MWSVSANELVITAIISPTTKKKPTNKQAAPIIMQRQVANSSHSSFVFCSNRKKRMKNRSLNQKCQSASDFKSISFRLVRFWIRNFTTAQIFSQKILFLSDFEYTSFPKPDFEEEIPSKNRILSLKIFEIFKICRKLWIYKITLRLKLRRKKNKFRIFRPLLESMFLKKNFLRKWDFEIKKFSKRLVLMWKLFWKPDFDWRKIRLVRFWFSYFSSLQFSIETFPSFLMLNSNQAPIQVVFTKFSSIQPCTIRAFKIIVN